MIETLNGIKETVNFKQIKGFMLYDNTDYEAYPAHWHTPIEILMPLKNSYEIICKKESYVLQEGDLLLINSGVIHSLSATEGERLIFQADFPMLHNVADIESMLSNIPQALLITEENAPDIHDRLRQLMLDIYREYFSDSFLASASIYAKLIEMLVLIGRKYTGDRIKSDVTYTKQKEYTAKFIYVCQYIQDHCTEDLSLDYAASLAGFSKYHFTRLFKNFTGNSFYKYLNKKRIEHAEKLLVDPEISITEVALQSGFSSLSAFIRMFKIIKDCTPTEFRSMYED
ncbi:MAG: helix-turn-helix domain-containing protein [Clostridiales bacterium]|nr:helix-turn-helix domain-containing protein [Clostridiales bacterium]